jgi:hypothetical protein
LAQITLFKRRILGATRFFPKIFTLGFKQFGRIAVSQHGPVFFNRLHRSRLLCEGSRHQSTRQSCQGKHFFH